MSEQNTSKNKIGARCLSDFEAELILPTYKRIYHQIDQFRWEKESANCSKTQKADSQNKDLKKDSKNKAQKTNNIGIIGARGAGKTSILKTIQIQLERNMEDQPNDIILPIVVPENMSESSTLMATILGMLSEVVEERVAEEKKKQKPKNADCIKKNPLRIKCDEVIKQYTYIQKEYRNILIQQYTTENDYVNRSAMVFNSDTEFIDKFNELIDELLDVQNQDRALLFLFIDDIDLSTYRCADVVKTLLSYLSNENIVTFISGDLDTFEEALTLDFLRQENVLDKDILEKKVGKDTLLASKKQLAYEYLKKIIPPSYRYNIKDWFLEERGKYCIEGSSEGRERIELSDLLFQALEGWIDPAFFRYAKIKDSKENENQNESGERVGDVLPYTYHLFDNTSRSLNNVYNVLSEIAVSRKRNVTDYSKEKKLLLDTIISSKRIYNEYRDKIQKNFFHVGMEKKDSRVFFDNVRAIIYKSDKDNMDERQDQKESQETYHIKDPVVRFSLFILADFAARLLYEGDYEKQIKKDEAYRILKAEAIKDLFFHPDVAEKVMEVSNYSWESKKEKDLKNAALEKGVKEYLALKEMTLKDINSSFLMKGDLILNLAYYKNLPLDGMLKLYEDKVQEEPAWKKYVTAELEQSVVIAIWKAFSSVAQMNAIDDSALIARYYSVFLREFAYIRNRLSSSVTQNIAIRLFDDEINNVINKRELREQREKEQMRRILSNTLAQVLKEQDKEAIQDEWQEIYFDNLYVVVGKDKEEKRIEKDIEEEYRKREQALKAIDLVGLWQEEAAEAAVDYLKREIRKYLGFIREALEERRDWKLNTSAAYESWKKFENMEVGTTMTIARRTRNRVKEILKENGASFPQGMPLITYSKVMEKLGELAGNSRVRYGQSEAQYLLNELQKVSAKPDMQGEDWDTWLKKHSYFKFLLQCLYKYKTKAEQNGNIEQDARLLTDIINKLSVAHKEADKQTLENFIIELNKSLEDKIDSESFEKLFSLQASDKQGQNND